MTYHIEQDGSVRPGEGRVPVVSPIHDDLSHFPPTLLMSGTRDAVLSATTGFHSAFFPRKPHAANGGQ